MRDDHAAGHAPVRAGLRRTSFDTRASRERPVFEPIEEPRATRRAANDDRETIGQILQASRRAALPAASIRLRPSSPASGWSAAAC